MFYIKLNIILHIYIYYFRFQSNGKINCLAPDVIRKKNCSSDCWTVEWNSLQLGCLLLFFEFNQDWQILKSLTVTPHNLINENVFISYMVRNSSIICGFLFFKAKHV